jgi:hypothetical protein
MLNRLLERGKTSGREDDNADSIKKRFSRRMPLFVDWGLIWTKIPINVTQCRSLSTTKRLERSQRLVSLAKKLDIPPHLRSSDRLF